MGAWLGGPKAPQPATSQGNKVNPNATREADQASSCTSNLVCQQPVSRHRSLTKRHRERGTAESAVKQLRPDFRDGHPGEHDSAKVSPSLCPIPPWRGAREATLAFWPCPWSSGRNGPGPTCLVDDSNLSGMQVLNAAGLSRSAGQSGAPPQSRPVQSSTSLTRCRVCPAN
ncbi:hypothetical protein DPX16_12183 [Anabarilius grahami]|uniref:Uncharacterized protein n=1 Tax=Anabarilius grahami TaxID=495550 RepID=A0A3N0YQU2_ANAGA|nr:hypothetical protein DPX16_12183 [Anabarilius grahami]